MTTTQTAQSVTDFCKAHSISRSLFYKLQREGKGPRLLKIGRRTLVTAEAATEWRQDLEARQ